MRYGHAAYVLGVGQARFTPVLTRRDLRLIFKDGNESAFSRTVGALVRDGLLDRITSNAFVNRLSADAERPRVVGLLAQALRPGCPVYASCEMALAQYGTLSQQPFASTFCTTGTAGEYDVFGGLMTIRHTSRPLADIIRRSHWDDDLMALYANPDLALDDLRDVFPAMPFELDMECHEMVLDDMGLIGRAA